MAQRSKSCSAMSVGCLIKWVNAIPMLTGSTFYGFPIGTYMSEIPSWTNAGLGT
jgi:hypothetical protein